MNSQKSDADQPPESSPMNASSPSSSSTFDFINLSFIRTILFYVKVGIIILSTGGSLATGWYYGWAGAIEFYRFVSVTCIMVHIVLILIFICSIMEKFSRVPWFIIFLGIDGFFILFYIIASSICTYYATATSGSARARFGAAAFFGFGSVLLHAFEMFHFLKNVKYRRHTQTSRTTTNA